MTLVPGVPRTVTVSAGNLVSNLGRSPVKFACDHVTFYHCAMNDRLPLPALLAHSLVAFTIEFDNESEHRMPHRTTDHGSTGDSLSAPWFVSMVMWTNCMQFVGEQGVTVRELERLARTPTNLNGMERWRYIVIAPDPADNRPKPPHLDWVIRATAAGRRAQDVWRPLFGVIEQRWEERFGKDQVNQLRESLRAVTSQVEVELPDCLPILKYGLVTSGPPTKRRALAQPEPESAASLPLPALLSKVLLAFAIDFESESEVSLAISANVLRLVGEEGVRVRDLPRLAGVSKEAIAMALSFLQKRGYAAVKPESPGSRVKVLMLTTKGRRARDDYHRLVRSVEEYSEARFGKKAIDQLRDALEQLVGEPTAGRSPLFRGLEPYPEGWRASVPKPETLPHYPMILHRGGFPDGS
jgi:DNA-binding MarR family transcriptional regulator